MFSKSGKKIELLSNNNFKKDLLKVRQIIPTSLKSLTSIRFKLQNLVTGEVFPFYLLKKNYVSNF